MIADYSTGGRTAICRIVAKYWPDRCGHKQDRSCRACRHVSSIGHFGAGLKYRGWRLLAVTRSPINMHCARGRRLACP
jgi:hypothetical protein